MKRKYPFTFFILGVFENMIRYLFIGFIGLVLLIVGVIGVPVCKIVGLFVVTIYLLLSIIEQLFIRSISLKESNNQAFNQFMDAAFGVDNDEDALSTHERIIKTVEDKIKRNPAWSEEFKRGYNNGYSAAESHYNLMLKFKWLEKTGVS